MGRWRLTMRESSDRAVITLVDGEHPVGVFNMSAQRYEQLCSILMSAFIKIAQKIVFETMNTELWQRAQRASHEDADQAMKLLLSLGLSQQVITDVSNDTVLKIAGELLNRLPEHVS